MNVDWLPDFFSGDNRIDMTAVLNGQYGPVYQKMLTPLVKASSEGHWPIILPFTDGLRLHFYAAAKDERTLAEIRRVFIASLGTAFTEKELPIVRKATNSSERVLLRHTPAGLIRITLSEKYRDSEEAKKWVFAALEKVLNLYVQRPLLVEDIKRPVGRILREFFTACQVSDGEAAEELFQEIKTTGSLSQRNLLFLQFQALAAGQHWDAILGHSQLPNCLNGRLPLQVTRLLLQSLGNKFEFLLIEGFAGVDPDQTRAECEFLAPLFSTPPLFRDLKNTIFEWQVWAVGAALHGMSDVASHIPAEIITPWFNQLFSWAGIESLEPKSEEQTDGKPSEEKLSLQKVQELLQYSLVAPPDELLGIALEISAMPDKVQRQIEEHPLLHQLWCTLQQHIRKDYGWNQWFADISNYDGRFKELQQRAINESMHWSSVSFIAEEILQTLETGDVDKIGEPLRDIMPLLVQWLQDRGITCPDKFWVKLLEILAFDNITNKQDVQLAQRILEQLLSASCRADRYEVALEAVELLFNNVASTNSYSSILEVMDLLLENPCPAEKALQSLWSTVQKFSLRKWHRLSQVEKILTRFNAKEIKGDDAIAIFEAIASPESAKETCSTLPDVGGKLLVIYSLTEGAARRAKEMLTGMFSGLKVELNHDHVATTVLENLAKTAEYFVFASRSAKHQAYYAVKNIRADLIYPFGKGASSIVRAFVEEIGIKTP